MGFFEELSEKSNRKKYKAAYDKAEIILDDLKNLPVHKIPYEILQMQPQVIYGDNESAFHYLTERLVHTMEMHREIENMAVYYYDKMLLLSNYVNASIARKRIFERTDFAEAYRESVHFLEQLQPITNKYHDEMISQQKIIEMGAYGEFKVNEKLKEYAKQHGYVVLENIRLEVGIDKESAETDTILITDKAIFSIETKFFGSYEIEVDENNQWFSNKGGQWRNMGKSPSNQSIYHVKNLRNFFAEMGMNVSDIPIIPVVIMGNPKTKFTNRGMVKVYSVNHMNDLIFCNLSSCMNAQRQKQIADLIMSRTLKGKEQQFFDYYVYFCEVREKMQEWFKYYDFLFDITMRIFKESDYVTYEYDEFWKIVKAERQILGEELYNQVIAQYKQIILMDKERTRYDSYFGNAYLELRVQRD